MTEIVPIQVSNQLAPGLSNISVYEFAVRSVNGRRNFEYLESSVWKPTRIDNRRKRYEFQIWH